MLGFFMLISVVVFSSIMYFVERGDYFYCTQEAANQGLCLQEDVAINGRTEGQGLEECEKWIEKKYKSSQQDRLKCCWGEAWYVPFDFNGDGCADKSQYDSIVRTAWWCVVTMTTVGYGDVVPLTTEGKVVATFTMLGGILILALPITVIGSNFNIEYEKSEDEKKQKKDLEIASSRSLLDKPKAKAPLMGRDTLVASDVPEAPRLPDADQGVTSSKGTLAEQQVYCLSVCVCVVFFFHVYLRACGLVCVCVCIMCLWWILGTLQCAYIPQTYICI
jgi:hypothetical protein